MFHIRHPIVLWQTSVWTAKQIQMPAWQSCARQFGGLLLTENRTKFWHFWVACVCTDTTPRSTSFWKRPWVILQWHLCSLQQHCHSHQLRNRQRISQEGWWGALLNHSLKKPMTLLDSSHISLHGLGPQSFLIGETQVRNLAFDSFFSHSLQFVWFSRNTNPGVSIAEAVFQYVFLDIQTFRTSLVLNSLNSF